MTTVKLPNYRYINCDNKTNYIFLYFQVKTEICQTDSKMEHLMHSIKAGLNKPSEGTQVHVTSGELTEAVLLSITSNIS